MAATTIRERCLAPVDTAIAGDSPRAIRPVDRPAAAGWYVDTDGLQRFWDGLRWSQPVAAGRHLDDDVVAAPHLVAV